MRGDSSNKIDDVTVLGLLGTTDSLAYKIHEIETHFHSPLQIYGLTTNTMARKSSSIISVTAGDDVYGDELQIYDGLAIEGGSSTMKFDMNTLYVSTVSALSSPTILEFYGYPAGIPLACTFQNAGDTVTHVGHTLSVNDKIKFETEDLVALNTYTLYYVINVVGNTFQVSLSRGGAAIIFASNGSGTYFSLGATDADGKAALQTFKTEIIVYRTALGADSRGSPIQMDRILCNSRLSCRGITTGGTCTVGFYVGLHTYPA